MGRAQSIFRAAAVATAAAALIGASGLAFAQAGPPALGPSGGPTAPGGGINAGQAARSGPGARSSPGFGGTITGRMNLIGPATEGAYSPPPLSAPALPPAPVFAPERLDRLNPTVFNQIRLPNLVPGAAARPTSPVHPIPKAGPQAPAPTDAALPSHNVAIPSVKQPLLLSATFGDRGTPVKSGVKWRLFTDQADANGEHMLVAESTAPAPRFDVDPGSYIIHAVYGLVSVAKFVTVRAAEPSSQSLVIAAGAVRLDAFVGGAKAPEDAVSFTLTRDDGGVARTVAENVKPGALLRLPAGDYHVKSNFGDANATVEADLKVAAGKLVEAQVHHRAAKVALKLVQQPGGPELRDTSWTILTPGGDVIRDSIGALTGVVLAEGDYTAIARRDGQLYQQSFAVKAGADKQVEIVAN